MANTKDPSSSKKKTKQNRVRATTKRKILYASILAFIILVTGGYIIYVADIPARTLTGAVIAGENVTVNQMNYYFYQSFNMYSQYGLLKSKDDLDNVGDPATGQTYRQMFYEQAAKTIQRNILLNREAEKEGFVAQSVQRQIDEYVNSLREYAKQNRTTADKILISQYGRGMSVRVLKDIMTEELSASEYSAHLQQTKWNLTADEMDAKYKAAPEDYDNVTFNTYLFPAEFSSNASDKEKEAALATAKVTAQGVLDKTTDAASFLVASKEAAGAAGESKFANDADPTLVANATKSSITTNNGEEMAKYLFSADRKAGDKTLITTDEGVYAVYFGSRDLDKTPAAFYRSLTISFETFPDPTPAVTPTTAPTATPAATTTPSPTPTAVPMTDRTKESLAKATTTIEGYKNSVTDENSFITQVMKYSEDANTLYAGGLAVGKKATDFTSGTLADTTLSDWLFSTDRKAGDMTIISRENTVTLYYFKETMPAWQSGLFTSNIQTQFEAWMKVMTDDEKNSFTINFDVLNFATY